MARIAEGELARLKQEISIERLAESQGIGLEVHGADRIGLCPFHEDREPSLVITPSKNLWHCLGGMPIRRLGDRPSTPRFRCRVRVIELSENVLRGADDRL